MTRQEFIDDVQDFDQLMSFANDVWYNFEDVYYSQSYDDQIYEEIQNDDNCWQDIRDWLANLPDGYKFYTQNAYGEWCGHDAEDIEDLKEELLDWADDRGDVFDDEEDEDEEEDEETVEDRSEDFDPDVASTVDEILQLFSMNSKKEGA